MKKGKRGKKLIAGILAMVMAVSLLSGTLVFSAFAEDETYTWVEIDAGDITSSDLIAITMTTSGGTTYVLPNAAVSKGPTAVLATVSGEILTISEGSDSDYTWTFTESGDGYTIESENGTLYTTAANNGVVVGTSSGTGDVWTLYTDESGCEFLSAVDSKDTARYLGVYTDNPDWRAYTNTTGNISGQTVTFYKLSTAEEAGLDVPSAAYSESERTITFSSSEEGVTYYYSVDGETFTALDGNVLDVSSYTAETVISYYASLDGINSDIASITIPAAEADAVGYALVTDGLETGDQVMIYYPNGGLVLTGTASGSRLAGGSVTVEEEAMEENSTGEVFTVSVDDDGNISFVTDDGYYLTSGSTGNSLTLETAASDYSLWNIEETDTAGSYYIKNVNAVYGSYNQYMEYYSGFTTYSLKSTSDTALYTFQFYLVGENADIPVYQGETDDGSDDADDEDTDDGSDDTSADAYYLPVDGDCVAIYYPNGGLALTATASGSRLTGVSASANGTVLSSEDADSVLMLNVSVDENGYYTFITEDGLYLTTGSTGGSLTLAEEASDYSLWILEETDGGYNIKSVNAVYGTNAQYIEYYSGFTTYSKTSSSSSSIYIFRFCTSIARSYATDDDVEQTIAQWAGQWGTDTVLASETAISGDLYSTNDMLDSGATYTAVVSGSEVTAYVAGSGTNYMGGSGLGSGSDDYLQFELSTSGWGDMELSFRLRVSNSGPASFLLQYSTDGVNFTDFTTGSYSCSYTSYSSDGSSEAVTLSGSITDGTADIVKSATYISYTFDVPEGAENAQTLYIRLVPDTTSRANGTASTPSGGGSTRIDSVVLTGSPIVDETITGYVAVEPDNSDDVAAGTELTLSSSTEGAAIYYRFVDTQTGEGEWLLYDENAKPSLPETLPATLETYAVSDGASDSIVRILTYAAGSVSAVKMSPNGGGVYIEDGTSQEVVLSTATEDAVIYYAVSTTTDSDGNYVFETDDNGDTIYEEYTEDTEIILEKGFGGMCIKAYGTKEGYEDSAVTTRTFTERSQEKYNIYFGQLHSHTSYSDGAGTAEDAYQHATEVGETTGTLDFLAITDHSNSFDDADNATITNGFNSEEWTEGQALADEYTTDTFVAIFGYEMTWSNGLGHINTYNTDGFQSRTQTDYSTYSTALQNYYETLKTVSDSISQFNHPGTTYGDFSDFGYYDEEIDALITLIEVGNGEGTVGSSGYFPSYEYYTRALDKGWHVSPTNNQDNHKGLWGDANTARTVVLADSLTEENIYDAMRNYRVYATEDNDLDIYYTLDGNIMGSILTEDDVDETVTITVELEDLTDEAIGTVEVIVNGGYTLASCEVTANSDTITFEVTSDYSYYYIQVTEADGDIAVTSPVWVGEVEAVGISSFENDDVLAVQDQDLNMTVELYNNEDDDFEIESISVTVTDLDGNETDITDLITYTTDIPTEIESMDTASFSFYYNYSGLGTTTYTVTVTGTLDGVTKVYSEPLELSYVSDDMVTKVIIDGTHYNDYVTGYYGDNMSNFTSLAADSSIEVTIETEEITAEDLEDCALLVISAPAKKSGTANAGDYEPSLFEDEFIELVADYVQGGGTVIICGLADYQDKSASSADYHTAAQMNKLLEAIGSSMSLNDDEAVDDENNGGQSYRLYLSTYNMEDETAAQWLEGIVTEDDVEEGEDYQTYSQYSGCTVNVGDGTWLVKGFETTYSIDSDSDGLGGITLGEEEAVFLAYEELEGGGSVFVAGGVFISDFEVDYEMDNQYDLPYANTTIAQNILDSVAVELDVTDIADVRAAWDDGAGSGAIFKVQGYVTSGTANSDTTFFDCIYIQDETGGIDIFPYAESGLEIGTKIEVTGYLASYQGDIELKVMSYEILDDEEAVIIEPTVLSCADAMDYDTYGGLLIQTTGVVQEGSIEYNSDGTVAQFVLVDEDGGEAKIFINGYILSGTTGENTLAEFVEEGATISAVGLLYMHPEDDSEDSVAVLRVRDCDEIVLIAAAEDDTDTGDDGEDTGEPDEDNTDDDIIDDGTGEPDDTGEPEEDDTDDDIIDDGTEEPDDTDEPDEEDQEDTEEPNEDNTDDGTGDDGLTEPPVDPFNPEINDDTEDQEDTEEPDDEDIGDDDDTEEPDDTGDQEDTEEPDDGDTSDQDDAEDSGGDTGSDDDEDTQPEEEQIPAPLDPDDTDDEDDQNTEGDQDTGDEGDQNAEGDQDTGDEEDQNAEDSQDSGDSGSGDGNGSADSSDGSDDSPGSEDQDDVQEPDTEDQDNIVEQDNDDSDNGSSDTDSGSSETGNDSLTTDDESSSSDNESSAADGSSSADDDSSAAGDDSSSSDDDSSDSATSASEDDTSAAEVGDTGAMSLWTMLLACAAAVLAFLSISRKKRRG